jgi:uncharacterized protein (DUF2225 family)
LIPGGAGRRELVAIGRRDASVRDICMSNVFAKLLPEFVVAALVRICKTCYYAAFHVCTNILILMR